jgi:hypothetical protein
VWNTLSKVRPLLPSTPSTPSIPPTLAWMFDGEPVA